MNNCDLIKTINKYLFENNENELLNLLNKLFYNKTYINFLQETFALISLTEMYGYLAYMTKNEIESFLNWDSSRSQTYIGSGIKFYNKGQLSLIYDFEKYKKVFLSAPTSFGKTSMVIEFIINNYKKLNNILFVVPTNSLLEELFQKIIKINKQLKMNFSISTQPHIKAGIKNFLLLTPERFFLVSEVLNINTFDLIVMDETYKIVDSKDESVSDFLESRSLRFRKVADMIGKSNNRVIFLSPFTYNFTKSMLLFLEKYDIVKIDRKIEYVSREIINISDSIEFKNVFGKIKGYTKSLSKAKKTKYVIEKLIDQKNIVYVANYTEAYKIVDEVNNICQFVHGDRYNKFIHHLETNYDVDAKYEWKIISALKKGIGIYVAPLPRYIKKEIINLYELNELKTLIVTTAFTEGVNTNASNLIFTSLINGPTTNKLSNIDILNVSGRAGRFAKNSIGKIYCIDENVYKKVAQLQKEESIELDNYNYQIGNPSIIRGEYAIEMIDDKYLTDEELEIKKNTESEQKELGLTAKDLNISLCVPNKWKLILYKAINFDNIENLYSACKNISGNEINKRKESLDSLFCFIRNSFKQKEIDPFYTKPYEIKAFDNSGNFIWGRLYKIYCSGTAKDIIKKNIVFIKNQYKTICKNIQFSYNNKTDIEDEFTKNGKRWILSYYNNDLSLNFDAFFTETFKFINSIIQYRIPFYVSFATSIIRLFIIKNNLREIYNPSELDPKRIALLFENGSINDSYNSLIDYGISNDVIMKITENNITMDQILEMKYEKGIFDEYELIILREFAALMK